MNTRTLATLGLILTVVFGLIIYNAMHSTTGKIQQHNSDIEQVLNSK